MYWGFSLFVYGVAINQSDGLILFILFWLGSEGQFVNFWGEGGQE